MATLLLLHLVQPFIWMCLQLTIGEIYLAIKILVYGLSKKQNIFFCKAEVLLNTDEKLLTVISNLDIICITRVLLSTFINDCESFSSDFKLFSFFTMPFLIDQVCRSGPCMSIFIISRLKYITTSNKNIPVWCYKIAFQISGKNHL